MSIGFTINRLLKWFRNRMLSHQTNWESCRQNVHAVIRPGEQGGYFAECIEIAVVTQGATLDEISRNLAEAVSLHLEDEDPAELGLVPHPSLAVTFKLQPEYT